jgi:nicotinamide riboside kinase
MTAPTVEAAIHDLMDLAWNVVYGLLVERGLLGDGLDVDEYTGIHSWVEGLTRYTIVHSRTVAVLFLDTRPVDAIVFHHDLLGADDPKSFFSEAGA